MGPIIRIVRFPVYASSYFDGYNINMDATTEPFDYAQEPEVQEIPMEKIQEVGQECNTAAHMDISRDEAVLAIENWLEENGWTGYQFANEYASNMIQTYSQLGGEKYERLTLNTVDAWYSDKDSTSMMIESDSYSGRVHMIYASGFSINEVSPVILCVVSGCRCGKRGRDRRTFPGSGGRGRLCILQSLTGWSYM